MAAGPLTFLPARAPPGRPDRRVHLRRPAVPRRVPAPLRRRGHVQHAVRLEVRDGVRPGARQGAVPGLERAAPRGRGERAARARRLASARCCCSTAPSTSATAGCCCPVPRRADAGVRGRDARARRSRDRLLAGRRAVRADAKHAVADTAGDRRGGVRLRAGPGGRRAPRARCGRWSSRSPAPRGTAADRTARPPRRRPRRDRGSRRPRAPSTSCCSPRSPAGAPSPISLSATTCSAPLLLAEDARRRAPLRPGGPRRARDAAARRSRDDRHRPRVDVRPAAAHAGRAGARARATTAISTPSSRNRSASGR